MRNPFRTDSTSTLEAKLAIERAAAKELTAATNAQREARDAAMALDTELKTAEERGDDYETMVGPLRHKRDKAVYQAGLVDKRVEAAERAHKAAVDEVAHARAADLQKAHADHAAIVGEHWALYHNLLVDPLAFTATRIFKTTLQNYNRPRAAAVPAAGVTLVRFVKSFPGTWRRNISGYTTDDVAGFQDDVAQELMGLGFCVPAEPQSAEQAPAGVVLTKVRFTRRPNADNVSLGAFMMYGEGDIAGFAAAVAAQLIADGCAMLVGEPAEQPEAADDVAA